MRSRDSCEGRFSDGLVDSNVLTFFDSSPTLPPLQEKLCRRSPEVLSRTAHGHGCPGRRAAIPPVACQHVLRVRAPRAVAVVVDWRRYTPQESYPCRASDGQEDHRHDSFRVSSRLPTAHRVRACGRPSASLWLRRCRPGHQSGPEHIHTPRFAIILPTAPRRSLSDTMGPFAAGTLECPRRMVTLRCRVEIRSWPCVVGVTSRCGMCIHPGRRKRSRIAGLAARLRAR